MSSLVKWEVCTDQLSYPDRLGKMDSLSDEIESILFIAREVMGRSTRPDSRLPGPR